MNILALVGTCARLAAGLALLSAAQAAPPAPVPVPAAADAETQARALVSQLTLDEKLEQLLNGAPAIPRLGVPAYNWWTESLHGAFGPGPTTNFPQPIGLAATFNDGLLQDVAAAISTEVRAVYAGGRGKPNPNRIGGALNTWSPNINIFRDPRWGRGQETYGEDPFLTATLAKAYVRGMQGPDATRPDVIASPKHFAVHSGPESTRHAVDVWVSAQDLEDTYLPAFRAALVDAQAGSVMCAYNRINGEPACASHSLLVKTLRQDWGFSGYVVSDCDAVVDISRQHKYAIDDVAGAAAALKAGMDNECNGATLSHTPGLGERYRQALSRGFIRQADIDTALVRLFSARLRNGDLPGLGERRFPAPEAINAAGHRALALRAAVESLVLLKNDGILPLDKQALDRIAVLGPNAAEPRVMGGGSAQINAHYKVSPLEGIRGALSGTNRVVHLKACRNNRLAQMIRSEVTVDFFEGRDWSGPSVHRSTAEESQFFWLDMPHAALDPRNFSARISTRFRPEETGTHVFGLTNAGFAKLYVDGELVVDGETGWAQGDNFFGLGNSEVRVEKPLEAGRSYEVRVDYRAMPEGYEGIEIRAVRFGAELPTSDAAITEAVDQARACDVAVLVLGREGEWDTEGLDLPNMRLPGRQEELIEKVAAANPRTVVVLQTGGPVEMPWLDKVSAVVQAWYPGQEAGNAIADVLFGDAEPGGRLPQTFPQRLSDNSAITGDPKTYPGKDGHVVYSEGLAVGYRHHDADGAKPLFPFGYGLSYTSFDWSAPSASASDIGPDGVIVEVEVKNIGDRAGAELVQLYVKPKSSRLPRPVKELKAFAKLHIPAGGSATANLSIGVRDLAYFDPQGRAWIAEAGDYELVIAAHAEDIRATLPLKLATEWREGVSAPPLPAVVN